MRIQIKCPVCTAKNDLSQEKQPCRRCGEDLSLLYRSKGFSYKYRVNLAQMLAHPDQKIAAQLAQVAQWLVQPKK